MKKIIKLLIIIFICIITFLVANYIYLNSSIFGKQSIHSVEQNANNLSNTFNSQVVIPEDKTISISVIGDIMCHNTQFKDAYSDESYDFSYVFSDIENYIKDADLAIGNLETTFAGSERGYGGYPAFNTPEQLAIDLKELGIDLVTTSNNHSLDTGYKGIESTLNFLDDAGISHVGTARSVEEQNNILIKEVNGIKIAILAYTYGTNGITVPKEKDFCINLIDKEFILSQLEKAKLENPDLICVNMHWGTEYQTLPNDTQLELTGFLFENGADIILGGHPHVLQPYEIRTIELPNGSSKTGFVVYSLGNFMSGQTKQNTKTSIILNLEITKNGATNEITIDKVQYTPIYPYTKPEFKNYKILDIKQTILDYENNIDKTISDSTYLFLKSELQRVNSIYSN